MRVRNALAVLTVSFPFVVSQPVAAQTTMTAGVVMEMMPQADRYPFVSGIIEGLAYARYVKDGKKTDGMGCIYDWFYKKKGRIQDIYQAFDRFKEHLPGTIVATMVAKECGD